MMGKKNGTQQSGFTIIEIMIATLVFSTILIVITAGVLKFTSDYYRGVNSSATQGVAASIVNTIAQAIQVSGGPSTQTSTTDSVGSYFCVGTKEFVAFVGYQEPAPSGQNAGFFVFTPAGNTPGQGCTSTPLSDNNWNKGQDLLQPHMRLVNLDVHQQQDTTISITTAVTFGDPDLLCDSSVPEPNAYGCLPGDTAFDDPTLADALQPQPLGALVVSPSNLQCKIQSGSQFCSVANLSTSVQPRL